MPLSCSLLPRSRKILSDELFLVSHQVTEFKDKGNLKNHLGDHLFFIGKEIGVGSNSHSQLISKQKILTYTKKIVSKVGYLTDGQIFVYLLNISCMSDTILVTI